MARDAESSRPRGTGRRWLVRILGLGVPLLVGLAVAEAGARLLLERPGFVRTNPEAEAGLLVTLESPRGFGYSPGASSEIQSARGGILVEINQHGFRDREWQPPFGGGVLAAGDSFTAGWGVRGDESWPRRTATHLAERGLGSLAVYNAGVSGYGMRQIRATVEELLPALDPAVVVVGVYASRALRIGNPFVVKDGQLVARSEAARLMTVPGGFVRSSWSGPVGRLERFCDRWFHLGAHTLRLMSRRLGSLRSDRSPPSVVVAPLLRELTQLRSSVEASGARLLPILIYDQDADGVVGGFEAPFAAVVLEWCAAEGLECLDLRETLLALARRGVEVRLGRDHHWSPAAHDAVARVLADRLASWLERPARASR